MYHSLALLAGMFCLYRSPYLISPTVLLIIVMIAVSLWIINRFYSRLITIFLLGYCWATLAALYSASQNLPDSLVKQPLEIVGCLMEVRNYSADYQRLLVKVKQTFLKGKSQSFKGKVSLGNYDPINRSISPGWCGVFQVALKPVHGKLNHRGFDYEAWAYVQNIKATGTVRKVELVYPGLTIANSYLRFRATLATKLEALVKQDPAKALIISLALGERSLMTEQQWSILRRTGTSHLLAISGLHIGLVFWLVSIIMSLTWRVFPRMCLILPAQKAGWVAGLVLAAVYLLLAGMPLSGRRAWMMLAVTVVLLLANEKTNFIRCFSFALISILSIWPSSVLSVGFWFSFAAAGIILLQFIHSQIDLACKPAFANFSKMKKLSKILLLQLVLSLVMLPLSLLFFGELSLLSPIANIIAIPLISFVILPLILLGLLSVIVNWQDIAELCFDCAQLGLSNLYRWLTFLVEIDWSWSMPALYQPICVLLAFVGIVLWQYYRFWPARWLLGFLIIPLVISPEPRLKQGEFRLDVFDVGQGLAAQIQTKDKNLLIDTGFGIKDGFSHFDSVIYPLLKARGVAKLDAAVISHSDADHAGGLSALINSDLSPELIFSSPGDLVETSAFCSAGLAWSWDEVNFEFITQEFANSKNNRSCVLKISSDYGSALLPGDIEKQTEQNLLLKHSDKLRAEVLIAPHHGSQTSSTYSFLKAVNPQLAIFSAGYLNRYGHPSKKVIQRYRQKNINLLNTACNGQITIEFLSSGIQWVAIRKKRQPFWRHRCANIVDRLYL